MVKMTQYLPLDADEPGRDRLNQFHAAAAGGTPPASSAVPIASVASVAYNSFAADA